MKEPFLLLLGVVLSLVAIVALMQAATSTTGVPPAPSVESTPHVVEEKLGGSAVRIDDFDRKVTCWVFSTGVSCLPFGYTRPPVEPQ